MLSSPTNQKNKRKRADAFPSSAMPLEKIPVIHKLPHTDVSNNQAKYDLILKSLDNKKCSAQQSVQTTVLHTAVLYGACPRRITCILKKHPEAACVKDQQGRTPLHIACICWRHNFSVIGSLQNPSNWEDRVMQVIRDLCDAAPYSINLEDQYGVAALEYAILSEMPIAAVKRIQKASVEEWRMRQHHPEMFELNNV